MRRYYGRREVHKVVLLKMEVFWEVTRCRWVVRTEVSDTYSAFLFRVKHLYFLLLKPKDECTLYYFLSVAKYEPSDNV